MLHLDRRRCVEDEGFTGLVIGVEANPLRVVVNEGGWQRVQLLRWMSSSR
jgi:hypothetical protein